MLTYRIPRQGVIVLQNTYTRCDCVTEYLDKVWLCYLEVDQLGQVRLGDEQLVDEGTDDAVNLTQVVQQAFFSLSIKSLILTLTSP